MKTLHLKTWHLFILLFLVGTLDCSAQSVADAARRERERQKTLESKINVVSVPPTTAPAAATPAANPAPPLNPAPPAPSEVLDNKGRNEKYWRDAFQKARATLKRAEEKVQLLDLKIKELNTTLLTRSDIYNREYILAPDITAAQKEMDDARKEADAARQKITDLEDELRKSGGPAGWAR